MQSAGPVFYRKKGIFNFGGSFDGTKQSDRRVAERRNWRAKPLRRIHLMHLFGHKRSALTGLHSARPARTPEWPVAEMNGGAEFALQARFCGKAI